MLSYSYAILLLLVIVSIANAGQKVCPGYGFIRFPENCESTCSAQKDECPSGKKCCLTIAQPCGFHCIVPKDNEPKSGKCPTSITEHDNPYWNLCDGHFCDVDSDCKGTQKCCHNSCGSPICIEPK